MVQSRDPRAHGRRTPRQVVGACAEEAVARHLAAAGWTILGRNVRLGRDELDIVALDPTAALVIVEVRSRSGTGFGSAEESVDRGKVERLYAAGWRYQGSTLVPDGVRRSQRRLRVDLVTISREGTHGEWHIGVHLRGLLPP